jgi:hypothetical protein
VQLAPQLEALIRKNGTVRLRKIDVVRWGSPVCKQFNIHRLPTLHLYDGSRLVSNDMAHIWQALSSP